MTLPAGFWNRIDASGDCWLWTGSKTLGYGRAYLRGMPMGQYAHRAIWEELVGPIPDGLQIDHLCRNRACVNPDHLDVVTRRENILRGVSYVALNARSTHCQRGHFFSPENTRIPADGRRRCKACQRDANRRAA